MRCFGIRRRCLEFVLDLEVGIWDLDHGREVGGWVLEFGVDEARIRFE